MRVFGLILRWSWRDLRRRWPVVAAIALVAAIGTGVFAALNSQSAWRLDSNDASYAAMNMHDLRVAFTPGLVDERRVRAAVAALPPGSVAAAGPRLLLPVQVETADGKDIRNGVVIGLDLTGGGPKVDTVYRSAGRSLSPADQGRPVAVLEHNYAQAAGLGATGQVRVSGRYTVSYVGTGFAPEYLLNGFPIGGFGAPSGLAVLFMPLNTVQSVAGAAGQVNDLVLKVAPDADRTAVEQALKAALARELPGVPYTMTTGEHDPTYEMVYDDAESDQQSFIALAVLVLFGATLAAFNLSTRVVQAQRREFGVEMALGVTPRMIAVRPMLFGLQVAVLGAAVGVGVGLVMNSIFRGLLEDMMPMPVWRTGFQTGLFVEAALIGLLLPFVGTLIPVVRNLRLQPIDAIRTGPVLRRGGLLHRLSGRIRLPGRTLTHLPLREVLRSPARPLLTAVGVGAAIATIIGMFGSMDGMSTAFDRARAELVREAPDRVTVALDEIYPTGSEQVTGVTKTSLLSRAEPGLIVPVTARAAQDGTAGKSTGLDLSLSFLDLGTAMWTPTLTQVVPAGAAQGLVLTEKAADDLGVRPGDRVLVDHPKRQGSGYQQSRTAVMVSALTPYPMRVTAYLDARQAATFGLAGLSNVVEAQPAPGATLLELRRDLLSQGGVASVQPATATTDAFEDLMSQFMSILQVLEVIALILVLLIAFNAASLNADERAREHATMFAYGYQPRAALATGMAEGFLVGILGTIIGLGLGYLALLWITSIRVEEFPDLEIVPALTPGTVSIAVISGVLLVTVAPILTLRRLRRMDLPATLRVVE